MTANSKTFQDFVLEQLQGVPELQSGRFFGGTGLTSEGVQFAMLMGNSLYFVVDDSTRPEYERRGMGCFWYTTKKGRVDVKKYYEVPGEMLEAPEQLLDWAHTAIGIARRLKPQKKKK